MPTSSAAFQAELETIFTSSYGDEATVASLVANAIATYFMGVSIGSTSTPAVPATEGLMAEAALGALEGWNASGAAAGKLGAAITAAADIAVLDATAAALVTGAVGTAPVFSFSVGDSASDAATHIQTTTDTAIGTWTATVIATGSPVTGWT
jgi:hypothetical protein